MVFKIDLEKTYPMWIGTSTTRSSQRKVLGIDGDHGFGVVLELSSTRCLLMVVPRVESKA